MKLLLNGPAHCCTGRYLPSLSPTSRYRHLAPACPEAEVSDGSSPSNPSATQQKQKNPKPARKGNVRHTAIITGWETPLLSKQKH